MTYKHPEIERLHKRHGLIRLFSITELRLEYGSVWGKLRKEGRVTLRMEEAAWTHKHGKPSPVTFVCLALGVLKAQDEEDDFHITHMDEMWQSAADRGELYGA